MVSLVCDIIEGINFKVGKSDLVNARILPICQSCICVCVRLHVYMCVWSTLGGGGWLRLAHTGPHKTKKQCPSHWNEVFAYFSAMHFCINADMCTGDFIHVYVYVCTQIFICIYAHTHIHTQTSMYLLCILVTNGVRRTALYTYMWSLHFKIYPVSNCGIN